MDRESASMKERPGRAARKSRRLPILLRDLSTSHPKTTANLSEAQSNRERRLSHYLEGVRLRGYEELIDHLEQLLTVYQRSRRLRDISFLIGRIQGDFQTGLEATLSGFHSVAFDAMRDVMEVEFLLRDFYHDSHRIEEWVQATHKERMNKFRPGLLRQRHAKRLGRQLEDVAEASDYRGHSMFLHVTPYENPFGRPGLAGLDDPYAGDSCFWDMFEHGRRVLFEAHRLRRKLARHIKSPWGLRRGLKDFREAWQRTQEMQTIYMALLNAATERANDDRR